MRRLVVVGLVSLVTAACSLPFGLGLPSTSQLLNGAADNMSKTSGFELAGKFTTGSNDFTIDLQYQSAKTAAHMDITTGGTHVELLQFGSKVYYRGKDLAAGYAGTDAFGKAQPTAVGNNWFTSKSATPLDMSGFTDASKVKANFLTSLSVNRKDHVTINGMDAAELSDSQSILDIGESSPYPLVRLRTQSGQTASGVSNMDLTFSNYGKDFGLVEPSKFFNMDDPTTFPPFYEVVSVSNAKCDDPCVLSAVIKNDGGATGATGQSTVNFTLTSKADNSSLGSCKVTVSPDLSNGGTATESCSISSAVWTAFSGTYIYDATADNPSYD